jgi:hypothetical protein
VLVVVEAAEWDDIIGVPGTVFWLGKLLVPCHVMNIESSLGLAQPHRPASVPYVGPGRCEVARLNCDRT